MHVIERTDRFTLVGRTRGASSSRSSTRRAARAQGALKHVTLRVNERRRADGRRRRRADGERRRGADRGRLRPRPRRALLGRPGGDRREYLSLGFNEAEPRGRCAARRARRRVSRVPSRRSAEPERRCSTTSPCSSTGGRRQEPAGRGRRRRGRAEHVRGVRLGSRAREDRVRRAQADVLAREVRSSSPARGWPASSPRRARELGVDLTVAREGRPPGGSMLLSSCVVWRHRALGGLPRRVPARGRALQRLIWERLDDSLEWLESTTGCEPVPGRHGEPAHDRSPLRPRRAHRGRDRARGAMYRSGRAVPIARAARPRHGWLPVRVASESGLLVRSNPWSEGDGLDYARPRRRDGRRPRRAVRAGHARAAGADRRSRLRPPVTAVRRPCARHERARRGVLPAARRRGTRTTSRRRSRASPAGRRGSSSTIRAHPKVHAPERPGARWSRRTAACACTFAGVTHTLGGLRVDEQGRVLREDGTPIEGLFAAGVDVGGIANGGYASGLAQALVLGPRRRRSARASPSRRRRRGRRRGERRDAELGDLDALLVELDAIAGLRRLALLLAQHRSRSASRRRAGRSRRGILLGDVRTGSDTRTVVPVSSSRWSTSKRALSVRARSSSSSNVARRRSPGASSAISASPPSGRLATTIDIRVGGPRRIDAEVASRMIW